MMCFFTSSAKPAFVRISENLPEDLFYGDEVSITCAVAPTSPQPRATWRVNNKAISETHPEYRIRHDVKPSGAGATTTVTFVVTQAQVGNVFHCTSAGRVSPERALVDVIRSKSNYTIFRSPFNGG
jgi:hypothetical protein